MLKQKSPEAFRFGVTPNASRKAIDAAMSTKIVALGKIDADKHGAILLRLVRARNLLVDLAPRVGKVRSRKRLVL